MSDTPANKELPLSEVVERAFAKFDDGTVTPKEVELLRSAIEARCERAGIPSPFASNKSKREREYDELHMPAIHKADRRGAERFAASSSSSGNPWPTPTVANRQTTADRAFAHDLEVRYGHLGADLIAEGHRLRREHQQLAERVGTSIPEHRYVEVGLSRFRDAEERQARRNRTDDLGAAELERHRQNSRWHLPGDAQN